MISCKAFSEEEWNKLLFKNYTYVNTHKKKSSKSSKVSNKLKQWSTYVKNPLKKVEPDFFFVYCLCKQYTWLVLLNVLGTSTYIIVRYRNLDTWINLPRLYPPRFYQPRYNLGRFYLHRYYPS